MGILTLVARLNFPIFGANLLPHQLEGILESQSMSKWPILWKPNEMRFLHIKISFEEEAAPTSLPRVAC